MAALAWSTRLSVRKGGDSIAAADSLAWCFTAPTAGPALTLHALGLALRWQRAGAVANCSLTLGVYDACGGVGGAPVDRTPLGVSSARVASDSSGALTLVGDDGDAHTDPATGIPMVALAPIPLVRGTSYCVTAMASCDLAAAQVVRARNYVSPQGGFIAGPWLTRRVGKGSNWGVFGDRADPEWGVTASTLLVTSHGTTLSGTPPPPPPPSSWVMPSPSAVPSSLPSVLTVFAPVGAPSLGSPGDAADVPDVLLGGDGLLSCFVYIDSRFAVRPHRLRLIPLAARPEDIAMLGSGASSTGDCGAQPPLPTTTTLTISTTRVRQRGTSYSFNVSTTRNVSLPLPASDALAQVVSIDASFDDSSSGGGRDWPLDAMMGGEGWCVGVGPALGSVLRVAHSSSPAGRWGPATCSSRLFSCYGVADYRGSPPERVERIVNAPWLGLDVMEVPLPTPATDAGAGVSAGGAALIALAIVLVLACVCALRWRRQKSSTACSTALLLLRCHRAAFAALDDDNRNVGMTRDGGVTRTRIPAPPTPNPPKQSQTRSAWV